MISLRVLVLSVLLHSSTEEQLKFPPWFKFGAATAAYQVEGAWDVAGKGESIWDRLSHKRPALLEYDSGDVACDSYHLWRRDIQLCEELGLNMYRFSISWTRLLPTGFPNIISEDGKRYYNNLINALLKKGIEPVVTIYHFDLPQSLQDLGGWTNPLISDWFADYARVVFALFADRVKTWLTINEPFAICDFSYSKMDAPYIDDMMVGRYLCNKYVMMAHAKAYRIYDEDYRRLYGGKVSLVNIVNWYYPKSPEHQDLADLVMAQLSGRYEYAIYSKKGGWPPKLEKFLNDKGKEEGYPYPRLPPFTPEERDLVKGTYDFYGMNHYLTRVISPMKPGQKRIWPFTGTDEIGALMDGHPSFIKPKPPVDFFTMEPKSIRSLLHWMNKTYGVTDVLITENGFPTVNQDLEDWERIDCISKFLEQVLLTIQDGLNVMGYTVWSLLDNFEWMGGYRINFGLYSVNFTDKARRRTPRESARYFASVTRTRLVHHQRLGLNYV